MAFPALDQSKPPMALRTFLDKKLRWVTLGGQYNWTEKRYPNETPPPFPSDIARLMGGLFPEMVPQAAIVNFYSPGDTLSVHRDVSEDCSRGLVSISLGCDAIFMVAIEDEEVESGARTLCMRLRSGDAVYMSGASRYAWHGVPRILEGTCPSWLKDWPAPQYEAWKGWITNKRINLNIRQMTDSSHGEKPLE